MSSGPNEPGASGSKVPRVEGDPNESSADMQQAQAAQLKHEDLLMVLRAQLNEQKLKLWESPYIDNSAAMQELAKTYSDALKKDYDSVFSALVELQEHAIGRSKANDEFKESGVATFRVRASVPNEKVKQLNVQKKLSVLGSALIADIAKEIPVNDSRIKLIFNGKVINARKTLEEQGVKNGVLLLALVMTESAEKLHKEQNMYMEMKSTREDAELLLEGNVAGGGEYMELEDQSGKTVELPASERRALMVGLALHEHGRTALRNNDHRLALVLLLEADRHFSECNATVLSTVDNWALLQLDVAWCYLCLQSVAAASDASQRLQRAEQALNKSYGENMERLIALKGTAANERTLLMRLHLLQAIVAYHQNQRDKAKALLLKAESELNELKVDEDSVTVLVELGWSRGQARTGLRAANGNLDMAHHYLQDLQEQRERARAEAKKQRQQRSLGKCVNGEWVSHQFVELLVGMGFSRSIAIAALKNSNNHVSDAVRIIHEQPELLSECLSASDSSTSVGSTDATDQANEDLVRQLVAMGYEERTSKLVLVNTNNDINAAVNLLVESGDALQAALANCTAGQAGSSTTRKPMTEEEKVAKRKRKQEREQALGRLHTAIDTTDEDQHLDASLQQEETYLKQYKALLMN